MEFFSQSQSQPQPQPQLRHSRPHHVHLSRRPRRRLPAAARAINPSPVLVQDPCRSRQKKESYCKPKKKPTPSASSSSSSSSSSASSSDPLQVSSASGLAHGSVHRQTAGEARDEGNPSQQEAVLESLAAYLEGELVSRLQSYSDLLAEAEGMNRERSFYRAKLLQIEKVCKHVQPFKPRISKLDSILSILSTDADMPFL